MGTSSPPSKARQRIVETADRLFYAEGVRSVGVDRIIAEAGVAKMTLYNHFASKDDLILAVLELRDANLMRFFRDEMQRSASKRGGRLAGFFTALKKWFSSPDFRGCVFLNTAAEIAEPDHPATRFCADHMRRFHDLLAEAAKEAQPSATPATIEALKVLVEGAIVVAVMERSAKPATTARRAAEALLEAA